MDGGERMIDIILLLMSLGFGFAGWHTLSRAREDNNTPAAIAGAMYLMFQLFCVAVGLWSHK